MSSTNFTWCIIKYLVPILLKRVVLNLFFQKIYLELRPDSVQILTVLLIKKWSFPLWISSVNVSKSAVSCRFGQIYWIESKWKTSTFVQRVSWKYGCSIDMIYRYSPTDTYMFKVNDENSRKRCGLCSKLIIKTPERPSSWCFYC